VVTTPAAETSAAERGIGRLVVAVGIVVLGAAICGLALTGNLSVRVSADDFVEPVPLAIVLAPVALGLVLARLIPWGLSATDPLAAIERERIRRELWWLVGLAVAFPALTAAMRAVGVPADFRGLTKVVLFLVVPLVVFRAVRGSGTKARAIRNPSEAIRWLAPIPAVLAYIYLVEFSPWAPPAPSADDLPDPVTLAVISLFTLLTASVLEEVFYRGWLQTRVETLLGRWPAIAVSSVLFAAMHISSHVDADAIGVGLATIVAVQGTFGILQGYLWSRYRNLWAPIAIHIAINLIYLDFL
jgi:CAAX protease family protein